MTTWRVDKIKPYKDQPAGRSRDTTDLQISQGELGQLYPVIVVPDGDGEATCLAGWRRVTAAKALGLKEVEVSVRADLADDPVKQAQVFAHSNIHQVLSAIEKAELALRWAQDSEINSTGSLRKVARLLGTTETEVRHLINLAQAPDGVKEMVGKKGRGRLGWTTFKAELSGLSPDGMLIRLEEAGDVTRRALQKARKRAERKGQPDRMVESTDCALAEIGRARECLASVKVFLRTASEEGRKEVKEAMRPIWELTEEIKGVWDGGFV